MFDYCKNLTIFNCGNLKALKYGKFMFDGCSTLTSFKYDLSNLVDGHSMFNGCSNLTDVQIGSLKNLTKGYSMFKGCSFTSINYNLSNLVDGYGMFNECTNLTDVQIGSLKNLIYGYRMFWKCRLNATSVQHILELIPEAPEVSFDEQHWEQKYNLSLGVDESGLQKWIEITGLSDIGTNQASNTLSYKGWAINLYVYQ